jgi:hypothetical protein
MVRTQIFRHGDRNPENGFKTDPYADGTSYIGGWGALTLVPIYIHNNFSASQNSLTIVK